MPALVAIVLGFTFSNASRRHASETHKNSVANFDQIQKVTMNPTQRKRFSGSPSDVSDIIRPFMASRSCWPPGKVDRKYCVSLHGVIGELYKSQHNLSFTQKTMKEAHEKVFDSLHDKWCMPLEDKEQWSNTMSVRLRAACHFVSQALGRRPTPVWLNNMGLIDVDMSEGSQTLSKDEFVYGWDRELLQAWRQKKSGGEKVFAAASAPEGSDDLDSPIACFGDGDEHIIADITVGDLASFAAHSHSSGRRSPPSGVVGTLDGTQVRVVHKPEKGRVPLSAIVHGTSQVCQISVATFDSLDEAQKFMEKIAKAVVEGKVLLENVYKHRDEELLALGKEIPKKGAFSKRPRGTTLDDGPAKKRLVASDPPSTTTARAAAPTSPLADGAPPAPLLHVSSQASPTAPVLRTRSIAKHARGY